MRPRFNPDFLERLESFPFSAQKKFQKQLRFLLSDFRHPSLQVKKYGGLENVWQARVDDSIRFYFRVEGEIYVLLDIRRHPK